MNGHDTKSLRIGTGDLRCDRRSESLRLLERVSGTSPFIVSEIGSSLENK